MNCRHDNILYDLGRIASDIRELMVSLDTLYKDVKDIIKENGHDVSTMSDKVLHPEDYGKGNGIK